MRNHQQSSINKQTGFTLVEIAIVMVIIGVLLGGVLKGRELIVNAKLKRVISDVNSISAALYVYQDRYRALPGDDKEANSRFKSMSKGNGNRQIDGDFYQSSGEPALLWRHLRAAGLVDGDAKSGAQPSNAFGGILGVQSKRLGLLGVVICIDQIEGDKARIIDTQNDDGNPKTGSVRAASAHGKTAASSYKDDTIYSMCFKV